MKKIKAFSKKYLIGFTLGLITSGIVVVCAATYFPSNQTTYNNGTTGMSATNVQTAIDELYNTCFPPTLGNQILENTDLEKDPYECRYFFTGATPNNYITFNDETWRIISVECDGTIKIMRNEITRNQIWDSSSNNWAEPASLNVYLNNLYYDTLTATAQSQIVAKDWSIGAVTYDNNDLANQISDENSKKWNGKIALITVSEYIRSNSNKNSCGTLSFNNFYYDSCKNTTWMYTRNISYWWTLTPDSELSDTVNVILIDGRVGGTGCYNNYGIRPTVYLSSDIKIISGNGSQSNPYVIA